MEKVKAATFAYTSTAFSMLTGTLVTIFGFLPIGLAANNTGQYCFSLFTVIAIALIASWFVAVLFTPYLGLKLLPDFKRGKHAEHADPDAIYDTRIYRALRRVIAFALRHRVAVAGATVLMFVA